MSVHDADAYPEIKRLLGIPEEEPIFILRAQDDTSPITLLDYHMNAEDAGVSASFLEGILEAKSEFDVWRKENPDRCKTPD